MHISAAGEKNVDDHKYNVPPKNLSHPNCIPYKSFIERRATVTVTEGETETVLNAFRLGVWSFMDPNLSGFCFAYPSTLDFDPFFKASRAFAPISAILGGIMMIVLWGSVCIGMTKSHWRLSSFVLLLTTACEGLTFLMLRSDLCKEEGDNFKFNCKLSRG